MKSILIVLTFMAVMPFIQAQPVKTNGHLRVDGTKLVNKKGNTVVLRGMSFGWHNLWPRVYNAGAVKWLKDDWHCNVVRASMGIELNDSGYLKSPAFAAGKIKTVVEAAVKN